MKILVLTSFILYLLSKNTEAINNISLITSIPYTISGADLFGADVTSNGEFLAVKLPNYDANGGSNNGIVHIYGKDVGGPNNWGFVKVLDEFTTPNTGSITNGALKMSGDYLIVGDPEYDTPNVRSGIIYIYKKDHGGINNWGLLKSIQSTTPSSNHRFGWSSSDISGDTIIGCAPTALSNKGACYVFHKDQGGVDNWGIHTPQPGFTAQPSESRGLALGDGWIRGNYFALSAYLSEPDSQPDTESWGSIFLFESTPQGFFPFSQIIEIGGDHLNAQIPGFLENGDQAFRYFDMSEDNSHIAACFNRDDDQGNDSGSAVILSNSGGQWLIVKKVFSPTPVINGYFCDRVRFSSDGNTLYVATRLENVNGITRPGAVHVYEKNYGGTNNWGYVQTLTNNVVNGYFGTSISTYDRLLFVGETGGIGNGGVNVHVYEKPGCLSGATCDEYFYCKIDESCAQQACTSMNDCYGLFLDDELPYCDTKAGFCSNIFNETCSTLQDCRNKINRKISERDSLGKATQTVNALTNLTLSRNAIYQIISDTETASNLTDQTLYSFVSGTETLTLNPLLFDTVNNDTLVLEQIKSIVCGSVSDICNVQILNRRLLEERDLQNAITVSVTYNVDSETFNTIQSSETFDSEGFVQSLADAVGVLPGNVTIILVDGSFTIEYIVAQESDGQEPLDQSVVDALTTVTSNVDSITSTVAAQFGLPENEFSSLTIDKCADRDCNGRGTCNSNTGICTCTDTNYWGVNCETLVTCLNEGVKDPSEAYCNCYYPYYGLRCGSTQDCACQAI